MFLILLSLLCSARVDSSLVVMHTELNQQHCILENMIEQQDTLKEQIEVMKGKINLLEMDNLRQDVEFKKGQSGWSFLTDKEEECCMVLLGVTVFSVLVLFTN